MKCKSNFLLLDAADTKFHFYSIIKHMLHKQIQENCTTISSFP